MSTQQKTSFEKGRTELYLIWIVSEKAASFTSRADAKLPRLCWNFSTKFQVPTIINQLNILALLPNRTIITTSFDAISVTDFFLPKKHSRRSEEMKRISLSRSTDACMRVICECNKPPLRSPAPNLLKQV